MVVSSVTPLMFASARVPARLAVEALAHRREQGLLLLVGRLRDDAKDPSRRRAEVDEQRGVAAVVQDHVGQAAVVPFEDAVREVPVVSRDSPL